MAAYTNLASLGQTGGELGSVDPLANAVYKQASSGIDPLEQLAMNRQTSQLAQQMLQDQANQSNIQTKQQQFNLDTAQKQELLNAVLRKKQEMEANNQLELAPLQQKLAVMRAVFQNSPTYVAEANGADLDKLKQERAVSKRAQYMSNGTSWENDPQFLQQKSLMEDRLAAANELAQFKLQMALEKPTAFTQMWSKALQLAGGDEQKAMGIYNQIKNQYTPEEKVNAAGQQPVVTLQALQDMLTKGNPQSPQTNSVPSANQGKFTEGKIYQDAKGNKAMFKGGQWVPVK